MSTLYVPNAHSRFKAAGSQAVLTAVEESGLKSVKRIDIEVKNDYFNG